MPVYEQIARKVGQRLAAIVGNQHHILDVDGANAGDPHRRLEIEHHAWREQRIVVGTEKRGLVYVAADSVTGVWRQQPKTARFERVAGEAVQVPTARTRTSL